MHDQRTALTTLSSSLTILDRDIVNGETPDSLELKCLEVREEVDTLSLEVERIDHDLSERLLKAECDAKSELATRVEVVL